MAKRNSGLGRGLDALFLDNTIEEEKASSGEGVSKIKISLVDPKRDQPRKYFDKGALEELAASITENGLLQPILVREYGEGRYQIIAGERRFRASKLAGLSEIPAIVLEKDDKKAAEIAKKALYTGNSVRALLLEEELFTPDELNALLDPFVMTNPPKAEE